MNNLAAPCYKRNFKSIEYKLFLSALLVNSLLIIFVLLYVCIKFNSNVYFMIDTMVKI